MDILNGFLHAWRTLNVVQKDKLEVFELFLGIVELILDVKFKNSFGIVLDSSHVAVLEESANSNREEPIEVLDRVFDTYSVQEDLQRVN